MITAKEARTILGKNWDEYDDSKIDNVISFLSRLSDRIIEKETCKTIASECYKPYN